MSHVEEPESVVVRTTVRDDTPGQRQRAVWLLLLLVTALLVVGLVALSRRGDDVATAPATSQGAVAAAEPQGSGRLVAGDVSLLPLSEAADAGGSLARYSGQQVRADAVLVESVPADEGFWVGTSATDRVWVQLAVSAESPIRVETGDAVSFVGILRPLPATFAEDVGLTREEGAQQLADQGQYVAVDAAAVQLS